MTTADYLTTLNIIVAFLGVLFVIATLYEALSLKKLKKDFEVFRKELAEEHYRHQQAAHKVIAAYGLPDPDQKIQLLKQAIDLDPSVFNAYNSIGYAYIQVGELLKAADAFKTAIQLHPEDKAGYCDLAYTYLLLGDNSLCRNYLLQAIKVDPSSAGDIDSDERFASVDLSK